MQWGGTNNKDKILLSHVLACQKLIADFTRRFGKLVIREDFPFNTSGRHYCTCKVHACSLALNINVQVDIYIIYCSNAYATSLRSHNTSVVNTSVTAKLSG